MMYFIILLVSRTFLKRYTYSYGLLYLFVGNKVVGTTTF